MYKVIVSQKKESTLNPWNESFLKRIPSRACADLGKRDFHVGLNENANLFFATRCHFWIFKSSQTLH